MAVASWLLQGLLLLVASLHHGVVFGDCLGHVGHAFIAYFDCLSAEKFVEGVTWGEGIVKQSQEISANVRFHIGRVRWVEPRHITPTNFLFGMEVCGWFESQLVCIATLI